MATIATTATSILVVVVTPVVAPVDVLLVVLVLVFTIPPRSHGGRSNTIHSSYAQTCVGGYCGWAGNCVQHIFSLEQTSKDDVGGQKE